MSVSTIALRRGCCSWPSMPGSACRRFSAMRHARASVSTSARRSMSCLGALLGDRDQQDVVPDGVARVHAALGAELDHVARRSARAARTRARPAGRATALDAVDRGQRLARVVRARHQQLAELDDPLAAEPAQVDHARERVQRLGGADVVRGLLAADVLLARLQREHEAAAAVDVGRLARDPARHAADVVLLGGEEAEARPAEVQPVAERLALADGDVDVEVARGLEHAERERVALHDQQRAVLGRRQRLEVLDRAVEVRLGDEDRGDVVADLAAGR